MTRQLELIETTGDWRLDADTIDIGRRGIAAAREALQRAVSVDDEVLVVGPARAASIPAERDAA